MEFGLLLGAVMGALCLVQGAFSLIQRRMNEHRTTHSTIRVLCDPGVSDGRRD